VTSKMATGAALVRLAGPYLAFRALCHLVSVERLVRLAWRPAAVTPRPVSPSVLAARTRRLAQLLGATADCLPRSLVLYRELSRQGVDPELVIGFGRTGESLAGHAWVTVGGQAVEASPDSMPAMIPACVFGARGRLVSAM